MLSNDNVPWVEKYRPSDFDSIVMDVDNKKILGNIIQSNCFPNLLLYGPPGTGKTTTIINLINKFQENNDQKKKELMIHLNASDERGIDVIRNQINNFVNSKNLFAKGIKFVILDEIDYMTKTAQQALKCLVQKYNQNVRFCLICNYISRIDESLQSEFMKLKFHQLPVEEIIKFMSRITKMEKIMLSENSLRAIQNKFGYDIRSSINYMQANYYLIRRYGIFDNSDLDEILQAVYKLNQADFCRYFNYFSEKTNINLNCLVKDFLNYIVRKRSDLLTTDFLEFMEMCLYDLDGVENMSKYIHAYLTK